NDLGLAYVHVVDMGLEGLEALSMIRDNWSGPIITNNGLKADSANAILAAGRAEAVSFGRAFIANPDLVERIRDGVALAKPDYTKLYTGEAEGYIDYPRAGE
ncbi:MAG: alkene reductase, partial [Parasphingorhabdus sp.]